MTEFNQLELDCLEKIESCSSSVLSPCPDHVLHRLLSLGLIEQAPHLRLPLEMMCDSYRLTSRGRAILQSYLTDG